MTTKEVKKMVNTIIDMNDTDTRFAYSAGANYYTDGSVIVDCTVKSRKTGDTRCVQDYKGNIFDCIDDARNDLITSEEKYIESKKVELEAELKKLNTLCGIPSRVQTDNIPHRRYKSEEQIIKELSEAIQEAIKSYDNN